MFNKDMLHNAKSRVPWPEYHKNLKLVSDARGGEFKASFRLYSEEAVRQVFS